VLKDKLLILIYFCLVFYFEPVLKDKLLILIYFCLLSYFEPQVNSSPSPQAFT